MLVLASMNKKIFTRYANVLKSSNREPMTISKRWRIWLRTIAESQSERLSMNLEYHLQQTIFTDILGMERVGAIFVLKLTPHCLFVNFWSKMTPLWNPNRCIFRTWFPVTSSYFRNWKKNMKGRRFWQYWGYKVRIPKELNAVPKIAFWKRFEDLKMFWYLNTLKRAIL